jgi:prepilin-type N-terminal cleavage/methylation domain-containing protein
MVGAAIRMVLRTVTRRSAFTLVELLVVIAIIGILVSLLMPAVQSAREAARSAQCKNNLKQIGTAMILHEKAQGHYPSCGWGWNWVGDPDRGYGLKQPGGWIYNILPFIEQQGLHDMGLGKPDGDAGAKADAAKMTQTPVSLMNCPTRRRAIAYPLTYGGGHNASNANSVPTVARNDYAANAGDYQCGEPNGGEGSYTDGDIAKSRNSCQNNYTGISYNRSQVRIAHVTDGHTNTNFAGEKFLVTDHYTTGNAGADNTSMYQGHDWDVIRWGGTVSITSTGGGTPLPPLRDKPGTDLHSNFGSAHSSGVGVVFGDGSVRQLSFGIDPQIFQRLSNRRDGTPVDVGSL